MNNGVLGVRNRLFKNNELNFSELFSILWNQKWFAMFIMAITLGIGIAVIALKKPVYEARAFFIPPTLSDVSYFNVGRTTKHYDLLLPFRRIQIYNVFKENLSSQATREAFLTYYASSVKPKFENLSSPIIASGAVDKDPYGKQFVSVQYGNPEYAVRMTKEYAEIATQNARHDLLKNIKTQTNTLTLELESRIQAAQQILESNKNNDALTSSSVMFAKRINEMQEHLALYKNLQILDKGRLSYLESPVVIPIQVYPRKKALLILAIIMGFFMSTILSILRTMWVERKM